MRTDFSKVLVERPRKRGGWARNTGYDGHRAMEERDYDALHAFESTSRHRGGTKVLNEHLGPLVRFLRSNVGRPWNDVHSELCAHVRLDNAVQRHVLEHLEQYVALRVSVREGGVYSEPEGYRLRNWRDRQFYVCPATGVLCKATGSRRRWKAKARYVPTKDPYVVHKRIQGNWFAVQLRDMPRADYLATAYDVVLKKLVSSVFGHSSELQREYGRVAYAVSAQQLDSRAIRRARLPAASEVDELDREDDVAGWW